MKDPNQPVTAKPRTARWLARTAPVFIGGLLLTTVVGVIIHVLGDGWDPRKLLGWLGLGFIVVLVLGVKAALHPIRGRPDASHLWTVRFPAHTEQEIQRFLDVVGESFEFWAKHWSKLRPDDGLTAISQQWFCGDGMELVELVMLLENEYSLELPEEFLTTNKTLGELFDHVTRPQVGQSASAANGHRDPAGIGLSQQSERLP